MIDIQNSIGAEIDIDLLEKIRSHFTDKSVELLLVSDNEIRDLNKEHRSKDSSTDVLSFPLEISTIAHMPLGSIVISAQYAQNVATKLGHSTKDEISLLFLHGLLHLLGYDHEIDNGEMREIERESASKFSLPQPLTIRI